MKRFFFGFLAAAAMGGVLLADDKADAEAKKLQGAWDLESIEILGKKIDAPKGKGGSLVFAKDGKLIMKDPGKKDKTGTYKIDAGKNPKTLDLIESKDGKAEDVMEAIYEIEGDNLKMGISAESPKGKRPSDFKGDKVVIMHLRRQKS